MSAVKILDVAQFICDEYRRERNKNITELDLQKYLYFSLREKLAFYDDPMFSEEMQGWRLGPVSPLVRGYFNDGGMETVTDEIDPIDMRIVHNVLCAYRGNLVSLSHKDSSWKNSRIGLDENERGNKPLNMSDIKEDARSVIGFDYVWNKPYSELNELERIYSPDVVASLNENLSNAPSYTAKELFNELGI